MEPLDRTMREGIFWIYLCNYSNPGMDQQLVVYIAPEKIWVQPVTFHKQAAKQQALGLLKMIPKRRLLQWCALAM